jgi:protein tyrosine/serine phosphatase
LTEPHRKAEAPERSDVADLQWEGCVNVRDVGGLVRADNVRRLSDSGWRALREHGVRRIVDLRFPEELADDAPIDAPVEVVHISLLGPNRTPEWEAEFGAAMDRAETAEDYLVWSYLQFLERYRDRFARVFEAIARAPDGPVLVHCLGGKDRTGIVVALALRIAGVSMDDVVADYALSEANLESRSTPWVAAAKDDVERRRRELMVPTPPSAMRSVLEELERRHGSAAGYLRDAGVSEADIERLRSRIRAAA